MSNATPSNKALASVYWEMFQQAFKLEDTKENQDKWERLATHMLSTGDKRNDNKVQKVAMQSGWVAAEIDKVLELNELPESYFGVNAFSQGSGHADPNECAANLYKGLQDSRVKLLQDAATRKAYKLCQRTVHEGVVKQ